MVESLKSTKKKRKHENKTELESKHSSKANHPPNHLHRRTTPPPPRCCASPQRRRASPLLRSTAKTPSAFQAAVTPLCRLAGATVMPLEPPPRHHHFAPRCTCMNPFAPNMLEPRSFPNTAVNVFSFDTSVSFLFFIFMLFSFILMSFIDDVIWPTVWATYTVSTV